MTRQSTGRRVALTFGITSGLLTLCVSTAALAQVDAASRPPVVFVILDTSGSMSYVQGPEFVTPACAVDATAITAGDDPALMRDPTFTYQYSRDMIAKEVLTGTFESFWCRERLRPAGRFDAGYPIPWYTPEFATQRADGVIDVNKERIKFAFSTFDTILNDDADPSGGWSLGPNAQFLNPVGRTNIGLQNATAPWGKLMVPPVTDDSTAVIDHNELVQKELLGSIPFGGTPIAPALEDTVWLFGNNEAFMKKTASNDGDPYQKCRPRSVLLITDGRPNMGEGALGYKNSVQAAERLFKQGYKVHVVGFSLDPATVSLVNDIAVAGGTEEAKLAVTPTQLATALSTVLGKATPGVFSRTDSVFTDITGSNTDLQYQINTAYSNSNTTDIDMSGYFEVTSYRCEDGCRDASGGAGACEVKDARTILNQRTLDRKMYFALDGKKEEFKKGNSDLTADLMALPTAGPLPNLIPVLYNGTYRVSGETLGDASDPTVREKYRTQIIDLIHGDSGTRRQKERLGAIWHSSPVLQTNLSSLDVQIPSFKSYKTAIANRPTMAYTMTHEGFIHAFHVSQPGVGSPTGTKWLEEVWAIAPQALVPRLQELGTKLQVLADGKMILKDVRLEKTAANLTLAQETAQWRSILVAPYRQGARGLMAVDVTDPFNPLIRWEITNGRRCWLTDTTVGTTKCETFDENDRSDFRNLGYVHAKPQIGTVFIEVDNVNDKREVAAAFFPCGEPVLGEPESGKCFMVVRLDTGEKIREFKNGNSSVVDDNGANDNLADTLDHAIVGDPVAYNTFLGTFTTRLFVGDAGGQLWRVDVSGTKPSTWKMGFFFDTYDDLEDLAMFAPGRSALRTAPAISPVPQRGQLVLVFGTGDVDYGKDTQKTVVYSVKEKLAFSTSTGAVVGDVAAEVNWRRKLNTGEYLTSRPIIFGRTAYFTSYEADKTDACEGGTGRIWGLDFLEDVNDAPVGTLDVDGDVATAVKAEFIELVDTVPYGATIASRPACTGDAGLAAAGANLGAGSSSLRGAKSGQLELIVQTGNKGQTNTAANPGKSGQSATVNKFSQKLVRPPKQVISVSWGQVQSL
ncbi:MAG: hypothetical protein IV100_25550 [Myxococcales bacterium]|nr:hypothetical protein [Myxococcales bacterium]